MCSFLCDPIYWPQRRGRSNPSTPFSRLDPEMILRPRGSLDRQLCGQGCDRRRVQATCLL
ncbi:hypothetical protein GQ44DRAFT_719268 [Phaeosphaeriaceae sp. PMI808]|nr:hypothetical protein GQ44DRAFT_719268 [Phaeosphaeriaceae sp. PMI808]